MDLYRGNAELDLTIENENDIPLIAKICEALGNETRLRILKILQLEEFHQITVPALSRKLGIPKTTLLHHLHKMEAMNLISIYYTSADHKTSRTVGRDMKSAKITFYYNPHDPVARTDMIATQSIGVGQFVDFVGRSLSFATREENFHLITDRCFMPERFAAQQLCAAKGRISYLFNNDTARYHTVTEISISLEICSEAPYYDNNYLSDITFWINGHEIATYLSDGDYGGRKGNLNPAWWPKENTQYGKLVNLSVTENGVLLNGKPTSSPLRLSALKLHEGNKIEFMLGNKDTAEHMGGFNLFGKEFGDYQQDIVLQMYYKD